MLLVFIVYCCYLSLRISVGVIGYVTLRIVFDMSGFGFSCISVVIQLLRYVIGLRTEE